MEVPVGFGKIPTLGSGTLRRDLSRRRLVESWRGARCMVRRPGTEKRLAMEAERAPDERSLLVGSNV